MNLNNNSPVVIITIKYKIKILPGAQFFTNLKNLNGKYIVLHVLIPSKNLILKFTTI